MSVPYRQCTRCVMDTSDVQIAFDSEGHCNHCTEYLQNGFKLVYQGASSDATRLALVEKIKRAGVGRQYDCVVGISGGVDSCFLAYKAKELGLRPLLLHLDNGWNSDIAVANIRQVVDKLGLDYQSKVLDWADFRAIQVAFLKASIVDAEIPTDVAIAASWHEVAAEHGIKYIICGSNFATEGILPKSWAYHARDLKFFKAILQRFCSRRIGPFPTFSVLRELYYKYVRGIRIVYLLNHLPYAKADAIATLKEKLGWRSYGGKHSESKYTGFLQSYILPTKFNLDYRRATLSTQICAGAVTREDALEELKKLPYDAAKIDDDKRYICKKLELSLEEFEAIMQLPPKTHRDYPNNERFIEFVYRVYRALKAFGVVSTP
jgi:N-acetyl sugar amidotransferase